jgi:hypothetical protein
MRQPDLRISAGRMAQQCGNGLQAARRSIDDHRAALRFSASQRRVACERLGKEVEEIPGGHLIALSNAKGLIAPLLAYAKGLMS